MKYIRTIFAALLLCVATAEAQTLKSLVYNTTNGEVAYSGTNTLTFTNSFSFSTTNAAAITRTNLGLGAANAVIFGTVTARSFGAGGGFTFDLETGRILDGTNEMFNFVTGLTAKGDLTISQTATNNGLLFIYRTNNEPFLGLANLIASNNTTISNETLFRVGVSEATNKAAQFGFRSTNTNGNGVAVFSVFGYNALMMIGPSDPSAGTNPIQATVYSIAPTNKVMTLITTNTGAMQMHRPIGIDTAGVSTNAPANTTNVAGWIQFYVGTNSVRVPYYQ